MKEQEIDYVIEKIDEILKQVSHKKDKYCPNFGSDIFVTSDDIKNTIEKIDNLRTNLVYSKVCESCNEICNECEFDHKQKALNRVYKIIKGDWSPDHV